MPPSRPLPSRRTLLRWSLGGVVLAAACRRATPPADAAPRAPTPPVPDADPPPTSAAAADPAVCEPTADNIEGPFFIPGAPSRAVLVRAGDRGQRLELGGRVLDTDCRPLAGAVIELWHADHAGEYDLRGWRFRGRLATGDDGAWHVSTVVPGRYLDGPRYRPRHIHVKVHARGRPSLTTQLYFAGDPHNRTDRFIESSLIMNPTVRRGVMHAAYDLVLA